MHLVRQLIGHLVDDFRVELDERVQRPETGTVAPVAICCSLNLVGGCFLGSRMLPLYHFDITADTFEYIVER